MKRMACVCLAVSLFCISCSQGPEDVAMTWAKLVYQMDQKTLDFVCEDSIRATRAMLAKNRETAAKYRITGYNTQAFKVKLLSTRGDLAFVELTGRIEAKGVSGVLKVEQLDTVLILAKTGRDWKVCTEGAELSLLTSFLEELLGFKDSPEFHAADLQGAGPYGDWFSELLRLIQNSSTKLQKDAFGSLGALALKYQQTKGKDDVLTGLILKKLDEYKAQMEFAQDLKQ